MLSTDNLSTVRESARCPAVPVAISVPASAAATAPSLTNLLLHLADAVAAVEQNRMEAGWARYDSQRAALLAAPRSGAADPLEAGLLELAQSFLQWKNPEAAFDVWSLAAERGSRLAPSRITEALRRHGLPWWTRASTLDRLPLRTESVNPALLPDGRITSEASVPLPAETEPLYQRSYRYQIAVYAPEPPASASSPATGGDTLLRQRFVLHFRRPDEAALARRLANDFAALYALMDRNLRRHVREDEDGRLQVWLMAEGEAGGEQWKQHVYFYDLARPRSNLEWLREAAHEYGHACLPITRGFTAPEQRADGELGERLFLRWIADRAARPDGPAYLAALNLMASGVTSYRARYVDPLAEAFARGGWRPGVVERLDADAMNHVMGLALWAEAAHGTPFLREMLALIPHEGPTGLWAGYTRAVAARLARSGAALTAAPVTARLRVWFPKATRLRWNWVDAAPQPLIAVSEYNKVRRVLTPGAIWRVEPGWSAVEAPPGPIRFSAVVPPGVSQ